MYLNKLLEQHKKNFLIDGNGFAVPGSLINFSGKNASINFLANFTGISFDENGVGFFGNNVEITCNLKTVLENFDEIVKIGWTGSVTLPQYCNKIAHFKVANVATDRTVGLCFLRVNLINPKADGIEV
jgi:hypothetical protein